MLTLIKYACWPVDPTANLLGVAWSLNVVRWQAKTLKCGVLFIRHSMTSCWSPRKGSVVERTLISCRINHLRQSFIITVVQPALRLRSRPHGDILVHKRRIKMNTISVHSSVLELISVHIEMTENAIGRWGTPGMRVNMWWVRASQLMNLKEAWHAVQSCADIEVHQRPDQIKSRFLQKNRIYFENKTPVSPSLWICCTDRFIFMWMYFKHHILQDSRQMRFLNGLKKTKKKQLYSYSTALTTKCSTWFNQDWKHFRRQIKADGSYANKIPTIKRVKRVKRLLQLLPPAGRRRQNMSWWSAHIIHLHIST